LSTCLSGGATLFIALAIGAILLVLGVALYFLLREALLSNVEQTAKGRAKFAAERINMEDNLEVDDIRDFTHDGVFVIVRDGMGEVLPETPYQPPGGGAGDTV
jgi:hypothetical protein